MRGPVARALVALATIGLATSACAGDDSGDNGQARTIRVPSDEATIQGAVDRARSGDLVLIASGTYSEEVNVTTEGITIRGEDRNGVILDGGDTLSNGVAVYASGVSIENISVHSYVFNGVIINGSESPDNAYASGDAAGLVGYRVRYVTAYNNGLYGVYAFGAKGGEISHSLTSGHPDSGIYVGQCKPCDVVIDDVISERNAIGYFGTNASGGVYVVNSVFRHNRLGLTPNSQDMELLAPQVETVIAGNLVIDNDDPDTPEIGHGFFGGGIAVGGGTRNLVINNRVEGHDRFGIGLVMLGTFDPIDNRVEGNVLNGNTVDLLYEPSPGVTTSQGNCFVGNSFTSSSPIDIEAVMTCDGSADQQPIAIGAAISTTPAPEGVDYRTIPAPAPQPSMAQPATSAWGAVTSGAPVPEIADIAVPDPR